MLLVNLACTSSYALSEISIPIHLLDNNSAATQVVAQPQKGSSTIPPLGQLASMTLFNKLMGFWVG